jgi:hypothetical protein
MLAFSFSDTYRRRNSHADCRKKRGSKLRVLIAYYSWTGHTEKVATRIAENFADHDVSLRRIIPVRERGYKVWLLLSFLPGSRVPILPLDLDLGQFDLLVLGCPKWNLSCPPFNEFIKGLGNQSGRRAALFTTFGGFDEKRYVESVIRKLMKTGLDVRAHFMVSRKKVLSGEYVSLVDEFCKGLLSHIAAGPTPASVEASV